MEDTKVIYHIDDEETPYLVKVPVTPSLVTLGDFKNALNRPNYKFFFKSLDADFGVVKEEILDDAAHLPCFNGKVISWLVSADNSAKSDNQSTGTDGHIPSHISNPSKIASGTNRPVDNGLPSTRPAEQANEQEHAVGTTAQGLEECETCAETDSVYSGDRVPPLRNFHVYKPGSRTAKFGQRPLVYETSSSLMSSDLESTSFFDSEDESSRFSTATGTTMSSTRYARHKRQRRHRRQVPIRRVSEDASSFSSMTDSTMSLNVITVTLNMDTVNFLGISIVGQSNKAGDGGIYVGSIMRGGAVAQDGRIEPGDMILEVNRISFEDMSNDEAVKVLREEVQKPGPITLVVAKCWDPSPKDYFTIPRQEPVCPIDPRAWVLHTNAMTGALNSLSGMPFNGTSNAGGMNMMSGGFLGIGGNPGIPVGISQLPPSLAAFSSIPSTSNMTSKSFPEIVDPDDKTVNEPRGRRSGGTGSSGGAGGAGSSKTSRSVGELDPKTGASILTLAQSATSLNVSTDMASVVRSMLLPDSGLDIRDRTWLKINIANAFIGCDLVDWLYTHVDGFTDRRGARRYAAEMLKCGYIRHTVNKATFSEQCYYVFGDVSTALANLSFDEVDSISEIGPPASAAHGAPLTLISHFPQMHHQLISDGSFRSTGLTNQTLPTSAFGFVSPQKPTTVDTGEVSNHSVPHYRYPPRLCPLPSVSNPNSSLNMCFVDVTGNGPGASVPVTAIQCSRRMNGFHNHPVDISSPQPVSFPSMVVDSHGICPASVSNRNHMSGPKHTNLTHQNAEKFSSSSSSHSTASSASSSSSSAFSDTRLEQNQRNAPHSSNGSSCGAKLTHDILVSPNQTSQFTFPSNAAPSVLSASGASSTSSASRQNGTGASAAGSGSGSVNASRTTCRPAPGSHFPTKHLDPIELHTRNSGGSDQRPQPTQLTRVGLNKTNSFTDLNCKMSGSTNPINTSCSAVSSRISR